MKEILTLTPKNLRSGRTHGKFLEGGIWDSAPGLNPYIEDDETRGLIAATHSPTDITTLGSSTLADIPIAYVKSESGSTYNLYMLGDAGHLYSVNAAGTSMSDLRSGTPINAPVSGMGIIQPRGGSATLLYARQARIGSWDMSGTYPTGWEDGDYDPGTTAVHRPFHKLFDRLYYGNGPYVGEFSDDGSEGIAHEAQALDLDGSETVTALGDDGRFLVIATARLVDEAYGGYNATRVLFWDAGGSASSWDWETTIPNEVSIRAIVRTESGLLLFGKYGVYTVAFGKHAKRLFPYDSSESIAYDAVNYGSPQSAAPWGDGAIFGKLASAYSKFLPGEDRILYNPLTGMTGDVSLIIPDFLENQVIVGTRSTKLYQFDMTSAGNAGEGTSFVTRFLDLGGLYHVSRLDITLPNGILGDMTINVQGTDASNTTQHTITSTKYPGKRYVSIPFGRNITTPHVRISILYTSGAPAFSELSLWGDQATN